MKPQLSNGYGSPLVVIDAETKQPLSGALVMFPEIDRAAYHALRTYVSEVAMGDDKQFMDWFRSLEHLWDEADSAKGWEQ